MIRLEEKQTKKLPGKTSIFVDFEYKSELVDVMHQIPNAIFHKKDKMWETPLTELSRLITFMHNYDDIDLIMLEDKPKQKDKVYSLLDYKTTPYDYQLDGIQFGLNHDKCLILDQPGLGKAVSLDTKVCTPNGFKEMRYIQKGDFVISNTGEPTRVMHTYYHPDLTMYRITFSDDTVVDCCEDHLWELHSKEGIRVKPTSWLLEKNHLGNSRRYINFWIPQTQPVNFKPQKLPLHPYVLGVLLGDGSISCGSINIRNADKEVIARVNDKLFGDYYCRQHRDFITYTITSDTMVCQRGSQIKKVIKDLGLYGTKSQTKFIPEIYLYNDVESRLELLRGLLDTDGYAGKENCLQYYTSSERLCSDVIFLAESLGIICHVNSKIPRLNGKAHSRSYSITLRCVNPQNLITLPRKKARLSTRKFKPRRRIKNIEKIKNAPGKCITVDSPTSLYLLDRFIVTHNTMQCIYIAQERYNKGEIEHCLVVCGLNTLKFNWKKEIEQHSDLSVRILGQRINTKGKLVVDGVDTRLQQLKEPIEEFFVITNIETLRDDRILKELNKGVNKFDMIVADEIHKMNNISSAQGKNFSKLKSKYKIGLTGTFLVNSPLDAYMALKWIDVDRSTASNFKYFYSVYGGRFNNELIGYKNLEILKDQLSDVSIRRTKDILDLPEKSYIHELLEMDDKQSKFYNNIVEGIIDEVDKVNIDKNNVLALTTRLRQSTSDPSILTTENIKSAKLLRAKELVQEIISQGEKVIVYTTFKQPLYTLAEELKKYKPLVCTGDTEEEEVWNSVDKFQNDDEHYLMLATIQKMGTGITLTRASYAIFVDSAWTRADNEQAEDRIHRIGAKKPCFYYYLWTKDTYDTHVRELVDKKDALSTYINDDNLPVDKIETLKKYISDFKENKKSN